MITLIQEPLPKVMPRLGALLEHSGERVATKQWQSVASPDDTIELRNVIIHSLIPNHEDDLIEMVKPNMPWAKDHFEERVGGEPLNPGEQYKNWPFYKRKKENDKFRTEEGEIFSHTYMERFWPKFANGGKLGIAPEYQLGNAQPHTGIRFQYGDLEDIVNLFNKDIYTRQAFLPIFFPEDTGCVHGKRVPCTLGYQFIVREGRLHLTYYIRSCDFLRHLRDDIYLAIKLVYWMISRVNKELLPGDFTMHITSLHCFYNERRVIKFHSK